MSARNYLIGWGVTVGLILAGFAGCNHVKNNKIVRSQGYTCYSEARSITGHNEFVMYENGSQELKIFPNGSFSGFSFYQDVNGDNLVDRIHNHATAWNVHELEVLLDREYDYHNNKEVFDAADKELSEIKQRYGERNG